MRQLSIREALNEALDEEMTRDDRVFLMGEEVGYYDGAYKVSRGLLNKFGEERVIDTPISENGFAGIGVGAAMVGLRPVIEFMTWNFSLIAIDQIINSAAKVLYMSNGEFDCPIVFRGPSGSVHQLAAQHSQSFESLYANCPGLIVIAPSNSYDAKGLLKSAIRDPNPVVFMESEAMYGVKGEVPEGEYVIPIGKADTKRPGKDLTILCWGKAVPTSLEAAKQLEIENISAEVIDLRTLRPLDEEHIFESVKKTNRVLIVEEAWPVASYGSWLSSIIAVNLFDYLDAPPLVHSGLDYPYPYAKNLEYFMRPRPESIILHAKKLL
ncbi:MAG TPA: pyruvate dehydrogenase complex E1 component subunit beta [Oligoflexia bacterium]|nr:pyruvate dehydrogenase complex E1 component subunit beta [Oligoflexia bacterium]HMP48234.1 pyruvate dehydrogenase complex E1 component subunit beta [Oligoflexia bacterium]